MEIRFHGQSCFEITEGSATVLVDPFLKPHNPVAVCTADEVSATQIVISHGHADHMADAIPVAKRTGAPVICLVELSEWFKARDCEVFDPNLGGTVEFEGGSVKFVPAWHTSTLPGSSEAPFSAELGTPVGTASGMIIKLGGKTVYHAGDTCLFSDMKLIGERNPVDIAIVPIGGHYTMDREDAAYACGLIGAGTVIPCHYNTFPAIETDVEAFKSDVESQTSSKVVILEPGSSWSA